MTMNSTSLPIPCTTPHSKITFSISFPTTDSPTMSPTIPAILQIKAAKSLKSVLSSALGLCSSDVVIKVYRSSRSEGGRERLIHTTRTAARTVDPTFTDELCIVMVPDTSTGVGVGLLGSLNSSLVSRAGSGSGSGSGAGAGSVSGSWAGLGISVRIHVSDTSGEFLGQVVLVDDDLRARLWRIDKTAFIDSAYELLPEDHKRSHDQNHAHESHSTPYRRSIVSGSLVLAGGLKFFFDKNYKSQRLAAGAGAGAGPDVPQQVPTLGIGAGASGGAGGFGVTGLSALKATISNPQPAGAGAETAVETVAEDGEECEVRVLRAVNLIKADSLLGKVRGDGLA